MEEKGLFAVQVHGDPFGFFRIRTGNVGPKTGRKAEIIDPWEEKAEIIEPKEKQLI